MFGALAAASCGLLGFDAGGGVPCGGPGRAVTIHVYSPPIRAIGHYDLHDGQLCRTQGLPDQPSPPSVALYEALHPPAGAGPASRGHPTP